MKRGWCGVPAALWRPVMGADLLCGAVRSPPCASTDLSKHGTLSDGHFPGFF